MQAPPNLTPFLSSKNGPSECVLSLHLVLTLYLFFSQLNILTLKDINKLLTGIFMYKCVNGVLPRIFSSYFTSVHDTHKHHTRWHNNLFLPFTGTSYSIHTLRHYGLNLQSANSKLPVAIFLFPSIRPWTWHSFLISFLDYFNLNLFSFWIVLFSSQHFPFLSVIVIPLSRPSCCLFYVKALPYKLLLIVIVPPFSYIILRIK